MQHIPPKKSLGQNFLVDPNMLRKIVDTFPFAPGDIVVEVGPGEGALTGLLLARMPRLVAVEKDRRSVEFLGKRFAAGEFPGLTIIEDDFLDIDLAGLIPPGKKSLLRIIGNLPYYVSSQILFKLFENSHLIAGARIMLQTEVARRLVATPHSKVYGIMSVALSLTGSGKILFNVPPGCFRPVPRVMSSVVQIEFDPTSPLREHYRETMIIVRVAFNQRRKQLRNALKTHIEEITGEPIDTFAARARDAGLDVFALRAEDLSADQFSRLAAMTGPAKNP